MVPILAIFVKPSMLTINIGNDKVYNNEYALIIDIYFYEYFH